MLLHIRYLISEIVFTTAVKKLCIPFLFAHNEVAGLIRSTIALEVGTRKSFINRSKLL